MSHGFRLFEVTLHEGRRNPEMEFTKTGTGGWDYPAECESTWKAHIGTRFYGMPKRTEADADDPMTMEEGQPELAPKKTVLKLKAFEQHGSHLMVQFHYGRPAGHSVAIPTDEDSEDEEQDISNHTPARDYRAFLIFATSGKKAVLAVESYGRACPVTPILRWTNEWVRLQALAAGTSPKVVVRRMRAVPLGDDASLKALIKDSKAASLVLRKYKASGSRTRNTVVRELRAPITDVGLQARTSAKVRSWFEKKVGGTGKDRAPAATAVADIAALVGADIAKLDFDDAWVYVEDEYGKEQKVSPERVSDVFTYPVTTHVLPETAQLKREIMKALLRIQRSRQLAFDWQGW